MMKLRNKQTGEIVDFLTIDFIDSDEMEFTYLQASGHENSWSYNSLEKFNEEWEDYKEPKEYWFINSCGAVEQRTEEEQLAVTDMHKKFGNYFETEEKANEAAEKLRAWKRLKDAGFVFCGKGDCLDTIKFDYGTCGYNRQDFALLFGEEE